MLDYYKKVMAKILILILKKKTVNIKVGVTYLASCTWKIKSVDRTLGILNEIQDSNDDLATNLSHFNFDGPVVHWMLSPSSFSFYTFFGHTLVSIFEILNLPLTLLPFWILILFIQVFKISLSWPIKW